MIDEKILSTEPFISYVSVCETAGQIWFAHADCAPSEKFLQNVGSTIEDLTDGGVIVKLEQAHHGVLELLIDPHLPKREMQLNTAQKIISLCLRRTCAHCEDYVPDAEGSAPAHVVEED